MWTRSITLLTVLLTLAVIDAMPARNRGGGGGGGGGGGRCKYRKGQWGECNAATSKKVRTDTLLPETSGSNCNATRTFEKTCRRKACEYGEWTDYGPCENNKQTKTRPILTGDEETCGKKAKKTKSCRGSNRGNGPAGGAGARGTAGGRRRGGNGEAAAARS